MSLLLDVQSSVLVVLPAVAVLKILCWEAFLDGRGSNSAIVELWISQKRAAFNRPMRGLVLFF